MLRLFRTVIDTNIFQGMDYIDARRLFASRYRAIPNVILVPAIDVNRAFEYVRQFSGRDIFQLLQFNHFDHHEGDIFFLRTLFILRQKRIIALSDSYAEILYTCQDYGWAREVALALAQMRQMAEPLDPRPIGFAIQSQMN